MSADFIQTAIDHVDTGSFILLTWQLKTKWIPAERALEKKERENLVQQFTETMARERKAHAEDVLALQQDYDKMVQNERQHFKDTVNTLIESFLREVERIESKISV